MENYKTLKAGKVNHLHTKSVRLKKKRYKSIVIEPSDYNIFRFVNQKNIRNSFGRN